MRHQFDHEVPTVIHHPEEKMTALARLTHRIIMDPGKYATWALGILAVVLAIIGCVELDVFVSITRHPKSGPASTPRRSRKT